MRKPPKVGVVWTASAILYNKDGKVVARCLDTPNAIAKALMQMPSAVVVKSLLGTHPRSHYQSRMSKWNTAESHLVKGKEHRFVD